MSVCIPALCFVLLLGFSNWGLNVSTLILQETPIELSLIRSCNSLFIIGRMSRKTLSISLFDVYSSKKQWMYRKTQNETGSHFNHTQRQSDSILTQKQTGSVLNTPNRKKKRKQFTTINNIIDKYFGPRMYPTNQCKQWAEVDSRIQILSRSSRSNESTLVSPHVGSELDEKNGDVTTETCFEQSAVTEASVRFGSQLL